MKIRILLLTGMFVAAMTAQAQTVTTNEGITYKADDLKEHMLENATSINVSGIWDSEDMTKLNMALIMKEPPESSSNNALTTVVFDKNAVIGRMSSMFYMCTALQAVTMPIAVNDAEIDFSNAFYGCTSLTSADLSAFTNISNMGYAFSRCRALTDVKLSTNEHNGGNFEQAFYECKSLASEIDLSGFVNISNMTSAFEGCTKLTTVKMPVKVANPYKNDIDLSGAFYGCSSLTSTIDLRGFTRVKGYSDVFVSCSKLTEIYLGSATSSNNSMGGTFAGCTKACKVYLPEGVTEIPAAWRNATVTFMINGEPAGISTLPAEATEIPAITYIYGIDGRLLKTVPAEAYAERLDGLQRGIYLVNGKKEAVQ